MSEENIKTSQNSEDAAEIARKYDLTEKMMPFLDRHLSFHLVEFLSSRNLYDDSNLLQLKYDLLKDTNMIDYIQELRKKLDHKDEAPEQLKAKRTELLEKMKELENKLEKFFSVLENPEVQGKLKQDKVQNLKLFEDYGVSKEDIDNLYYLGQLKFSTGEYKVASEMLDQFRIVSTDNKLIQSATWGKLAIEIIGGMNVPAVTEEIMKIRDIVDQRSFADSITQLHNRTWIIHWSLFLFISKDFNKESLIDLFFSPSYMSTIQASCPWIIRYIAAAVISLNKGRNAASFQRRLKDLVRVVGQELYEYQDPVTDFIRALYIDFDFAEAQNKLTEAEAVLSNDFFLNGSTSEFLESSRHLVSELYCRIHQRIDVAQLSTRLNLSTEQGEKWIANLIKDTKMDAKIDESNGTVIMNHPVNSVYQEVIDRTKGLTFRSNQTLSQVVSKNDSVIA